MDICFVTLFPETVLAGVRHSILKRAEDAGLIRFTTVNPRAFSTDARGTVDDEPYGGGPGMVLRADVAGAAVESALRPGHSVVFTDPAGASFDHSRAKELAALPGMVLVCGHYEGMDERVVERYATHRLSIGDYVLTGGEPAAVVIADAVARLLPGVLGSESSLREDTHFDGLLTYPQYTRPPEWQSMRPPEVLLGGDHGAIAKWRRRQRLLVTRERRPDLFATAPLSLDDLDLLQ